MGAINKENKLRVLKENFLYNASAEQTLVEYIANEAENDPKFFAWLFDADLDKDFSCPDKKEYESFLNYARRNE